MLATLAFAGAGQALAPAPAAALHIDACEQPQSGLCNRLDDSRASGDNSSDDGKGGGRSDGWAFVPPPPSSAPWEKGGSRPTWNHVLNETFRRNCQKIGGQFADTSDAIDMTREKLLREPPGRHSLVRLIAKRILKQLKTQLNDLADQWDSFNCTELGL